MKGDIKGKAKERDKEKEVGLFTYLCLSLVIYSVEWITIKGVLSIAGYQ